MAPRKAALIKATASGTEVQPNVREEPVDELDLAEHQAEVLTPSHTEIETFDGKSYFLPNEFTLKDIFRNRVENALLGFVNVANFELSKLGASFGSEHLTFDAIAAMLLKETTQNAIAELLHIVTKKPVSEFEGKLDAKNLIAVWVWVNNHFAKKKASDSNSKN